MTTFLQDRLTAIEAEIIAVEAAILALVSGGVQSYSLDTGQTKQTVTKLDLDKLNNMRDGLYNQYTVIRARLGLGGTVTMGPAW